MRVLALVGNMAPQRKETAAPSDRIVEDLGYDSLLFMVLLTEIFDDLGLDLPAPEGFENLERVRTAAQLADEIIDQVGQAHKDDAEDEP